MIKDLLKKENQLKLKEIIKEKFEPDERLEVWIQLQKLKQ